MRVEMREGLDEAGLRAVGRLRARVWSQVVPALRSYEMLLDSFDANAWHLLVGDGNGALDACARLTLHQPGQPCPDAASYGDYLAGRPGLFGVIGGLVVAPSARGRGLAHRLDEARLALARRLPCRRLLVACSSGPSRQRALEAQGFVVVGERHLGPRFATKVPPRPGVVLALELGARAGRVDRETSA